MLCAALAELAPGDHWRFLIHHQLSRSGGIATTPLTRCTTSACNTSLRACSMPCHAITSACNTPRPQDVGNMLWAFGKLRYKAVRLMDELPLHLGPWLHEFSTADLCCLLAGYTNGRHYHRCERAWCGCMCVWGCAIRPLLTCAAACGRAAPAASTPSSELHVHRTCCGRALSAHTGQPVFFVCMRWPTRVPSCRAHWRAHTTHIRLHAHPHTQRHMLP